MSAKARTLLARNAEVLVTMDPRRREIRGGGLYAEGNRIVAVGTASELPDSADEVVDLSGHVVLPGLVNTHHHMFQCLTRAVPAAQDAGLFGWLKAFYPIWSRLTPEMIRVSATTAMAELLLSGCTTSSDHLYLFPNGCRLDDTIEAAGEIGMRFHATRGSMSVGESKGGLPPDRLVEAESAILRDTVRVIGAYNDPREFSMRRVGVAPCSPFSVSADLMKASAELARSMGVRLHTHLAENDDDVAYCKSSFGGTPAQFAESLGWVGEDVWHAHCVKLDGHGIGLFARTGTGVAHCPCSNMRLGSGIAPVCRMVEAGVPVGLGVDGSASNDSGHLLAETRQAMLLQRVQNGAPSMSARAALELATLGGARVLGRSDIGSLEAGKAADFAAFDVRTAAFAGAGSDLVAALVLCSPASAALTVVNGRTVVKDGNILTVDLPMVLERHGLLAGRVLVDE